MKKVICIIMFLFLISLSIFVYVIYVKKNDIHVNTFKPTLLNKKDKIEYTLFFYSTQKSTQNEKISLFSATLAQDCFQLINQWLLRAWQRRVITVPIKCQSVILDPVMTTVFVSFDFSLFDDTVPLNIKINIINSLLKTIQQVCPAFQYVYFLVRHEPIIDKHVDWVKPFSIAGYPVTSF